MKLISIFLIIASACLFQADSPITADCMCKEIPLYGKVQVVNSFADFKVEVVTSFEDLKVEKVITTAFKCGQWEFVNTQPDFTIEYVTIAADFKIRFDNSFPGIP
jgi:hypothetical protein